MRFRMQDLIMDIGPGLNLANERCTCAASANPGLERAPDTEEGSHPESPRGLPGSLDNELNEQDSAEPGDLPRLAGAGVAALAALRTQLRQDLGAGA